MRFGEPAIVANPAGVPKMRFENRKLGLMRGSMPITGFLGEPQELQRTW
jgi:hypothetical protein